MIEHDSVERGDGYEQERQNAELILNELCRMIDLFQGIADNNLIAGLERARDEAIRALARMPTRSAH